MKIITLNESTKDLLKPAGQMLYDGFQEIWPFMVPDMDAACRLVDEAVDAQRVCRAAVDGEGKLLGWCGAVPEYNGNVWVVHPMVVRNDRQGEGIGRALLEDLEDRVRLRGAVTMFLGTDDTVGMTSLANVDLYANVFDHLAKIQNYGRHPYEFYQKCGYTIVGVVPDANGLGKPDIYMAKRLT